MQRELTKNELKKVMELVPNYMNWADAISFAIQELELPTNNELK